MKEKYDVLFEGGVSKLDDVSGMNYMLTTIKDEDGDDVELYAEERQPDELDEYHSKELDERGLKIMQKFDDESYELLKREIIEQAKEYHLTEDDFNFN